MRRPSWSDRARPRVKGHDPAGNGHAGGQLEIQGRQHHVRSAVWLLKGAVEVLAQRIVSGFPLTEKSADEDSPLPASNTMEVADAGLLMPPGGSVLTRVFRKSALSPFPR